MSAADTCEVIGRWRIAGSDLWDRDYLDLLEPAFISIGRDGRGELAFGVVNALLDLSYSRTIVFSPLRAAARALPSSSTTAPLRSRSHSITAAVPPSEPGQTLLSALLQNGP
ncbi:hypothetical protein [Microvirga sp. KLBC 81]|uniref:hypothetical protein n=1 Tax=Microvirga sp. KLBC 81 TaxID=1862707 RepID=UPI001FDF3C47|nr:hypothetical protein [Microvirga sp. KLBC 81]